MMKRIASLALAALPLGALPPMVEPANAQLTIQFGGSRQQPPVYVQPAPRPVIISPRRSGYRVRRVWVPGRWERRREYGRYNGRYVRVWVPGHYR